MSNDKVTRPPAKTAAERQAERRARINADLEAARVARYQVRSFNQLFTECMGEGLQFTLQPGDLDLSDPLESINQFLKAALCESRQIRKTHPLDYLKEKARRDGQAALPGSKAPKLREPRKTPDNPATETATKGRSRAVKPRNRVAA